MLRAIYALFYTDMSIKKMETVMLQYWIMTPAAEWDDWKKDGIVTLKWNLTRNYLHYTKEELVKELKIRMGIGKGSDKAKQIVEFSQTMQIGDYIFFRKNDYIIAYGKVASDYMYDPDSRRKHVRKVQWISNRGWDINQPLPHKDLKNITDDPINKVIMDIVFKKE